MHPSSVVSHSALVTHKKECQNLGWEAQFNCFIPAAFLLSTGVQHMRKSSLVRPKVQLAEWQMLRKTRYLEIYPSLEMPFQVLELSHSRTAWWHLLRCLFSLIGTSRFKAEIIFLWHYAELCEVNLHATSSSLSVIAWHALYAPDWQPVLFPHMRLICCGICGRMLLLFPLIPSTGMGLNVNGFQLEPQHSAAI